jgi:carotene biosynthesis associated membrane protein
MTRAGGIVAWTFLTLHGLAMLLGLFGLLIAIPHASLFAGNAAALAFFPQAMNNTGGTGMLLGALAMLAWGIWQLGWRRTLLFFICATVISATAELTGTKTGWPFGGYEYTNFLGPKLLGRVPVAIPLSWFYMGFASFVLADAIVAARGVARRTFWSIVLGAWLLTAWDLVLDPSMAAPNMQYIHFWIWHETGPYFGMPLRNLAGWFATGLVFIAAGRYAWNETGAPRARVALPFAIYAINVVWSMIISTYAGMWPTAILAIAVSLLPAALAFRTPRFARA